MTAALGRHSKYITETRGGRHSYTGACLPFSVGGGSGHMDKARMTWNWLLSGKHAKDHYAKGFRMFTGR